MIIVQGLHVIRLYVLLYLVLCEVLSAVVLWLVLRHLQVHVSDSLQVKVQAARVQSPCVAGHFLVELVGVALPFARQVLPRVARQLLHANVELVPKLAVICFLKSV